MCTPDCTYGIMQLIKVFVSSCVTQKYFDTRWWCHNRNMTPNNIQAKARMAAGSGGVT